MAARSYLSLQNVMRSEPRQSPVQSGLSVLPSDGEEEAPPESKSHEDDPLEERSVLDAREMGDRVQRRHRQPNVSSSNRDLAQIGVDERRTRKVPPSELDLPLGGTSTHDDVEPFVVGFVSTSARACAELEHGGVVR